MNFCQYISGKDYSNGYPTSGEGGDYGGGGRIGRFGGRYWEYLKKEMENI